MPCWVQRATSLDLSQRLRMVRGGRHAAHGPNRLGGDHDQKPVPILDRPAIRQVAVSGRFLRGYSLLCEVGCGVRGINLTSTMS